MTEDLDESAKVVLDGIEDVKTPDDANALLARLMHANLVDYQNTTGALIENYQRQISDLQAELKAVRTRVAQLFGSDYMPSESAIIAAVFHPTRELIDSCRRAQGAF
jgi:hypothetical protein